MFMVEMDQMAHLIVLAILCMYLNILALACHMEQHLNIKVEKVPKLQNKVI